MVSKEAIDFLTRQIMKIEAIIEGKVELKPSNTAERIRRGKDSGAHHLAGDRSDQLIRQGRQLRILLPQSIEQMAQQRQGERQREQEERQQVSGMGLF